MKVENLAIPDVKRITPKTFGDARGFFSETFKQNVLESAGIGVTFVQDNHAFSAVPGTVRGLHYQIPPMAQAKLVRVTRGAILDIAVDIRTGSPTYGRHVAEVLSAKNWAQVFVPEGFAHGYCTLEPDTEVIYKVNAYYSPTHDRGIFWNDPKLGIDWPVTAANAGLSDKDRLQPPLADITSPFAYFVSSGAR